MSGQGAELPFDAVMWSFPWNALVIRSTLNNAGLAAVSAVWARLNRHYPAKGFPSFFEGAIPSPWISGHIVSTIMVCLVLSNAVVS
jgi:hypothetical protein